jgi:DNA transposition AAA+ family ATPase
MSEESTKDSNPVRRPIDTLIDRERIRGASRMIPQGTDPKDVSEDQIRDVISDAQLFLRAHKVSQMQMAKAVGYSSSVITDFLKGQYKGDRGNVAIMLDDWLVAEEQRRATPATTQFVWTNVAMEIKSIASYCLDKRKIGLIYGPDTSGIGKTTALRAIHQELGPRRSSLVTIDKVDASPTGLLRKICQGIGKGDSGTNHERKERILAHLAGRQHLLIIDQAHNLRFAAGDKPFYILTDLQDATEKTCAQLWCGTADLYKYLHKRQGSQADESLAQVRRRIFPIIDLMASLAGGGNPGDLLVTVEQVQEMFAKNKLRLTPTAARFLCSLCNLADSGSVGLCVYIVEYATTRAEMKNLKSIDETLLREAMRMGFAPERGAEILRSAQAVQERLARSA